MSDISAALSEVPLTTAASPVATSRVRTIFRSLELWLPLGLLVLILFLCFIWPEVYSLPNPVGGNLSDVNLPPFSPHHLLGTDPLGNDIVSRLLYGGRVSLSVGFGSAAIGLVVGGVLGIVAGYLGRVTDIVVSRGLDILLSFPSLVLAMVIATSLGPGELHLVWAICFFSIPAFARLARASTLRVCAQPFVDAARLSGASSARIMARHVAPNVFPGLLTFSLLSVSVAIIVESSLSFLGLGVPPPGASLGNMIQVGEQNIYGSPMLIIIPSAFLFLLVLTLNLLGDAIRIRLASR